MPVFCGDIVSKGIFIAVGCNFGITCGAGSEEHKHRVIAARGIFGSVKAAAEELIFISEIVPAFSGFANNDFGYGFVICFACKIDLVCNVTHSGADNCFYIGGFETVFKVMLKKLVGCGNYNCTDFVKTKD